MYARETNSLKTLWENLKKKNKLTITAQADDINGTGILTKQHFLKTQSQSGMHIFSTNIFC